MQRRLCPIAESLEVELVELGQLALRDVSGCLSLFNSIHTHRLPVVIHMTLPSVRFIGVEMDGRCQRAVDFSVIGVKQRHISVQGVGPGCFESPQQTRRPPQKDTGAEFLTVFPTVVANFLKQRSSFAAEQIILPEINDDLCAFAGEVVDLNIVVDVVRSRS